MEDDKKIKGNESELNSLFKETLDGLRDDLTEADDNVQLYLEAILNDSGGKELYGSLYNDALKIKGSTRDRFLKFLALIKDRVNKKEDQAFRTKETTGSEFAINHGDLNELVFKINNSKGENVIPQITITPKIEDDGEEFEDGDFDEEN